MGRISTLTAAGALFLSSFGVTAAMSPLSSAADAPPTFAYSISYEAGPGGELCGLVKIDLGTGEVTDFPAALSSDACVYDLTVAPDGTPWGILGGPDEETFFVAMVEFSPTTGEVVQVLPVDFDPDDDPDIYWGGIVFIGDTTYIMASIDSCEGGDTPCLFTVDMTTGTPTMIGPSGFYDGPLFQLSDCGGLKTFEAAWDDTDTYTYASVDPDSGAATPILPGITDQITGFDCAGSVGFALAWDSETDELVLSGMNPSTGELIGSRFVLADGDSFVKYDTLALPPVQTPDTTTSTTAAPSTTTTSTTQATRPAANTVQPRFAG